MRNRPSAHLFLLLILFALEALAYLAIYRAGVTRGHAPSLLLAMRDLLLFLPIVGVVLWLARRFKYAGDWTLLTVAILLFCVGQVVQYRLFTDPEYGTRQKNAARLEKMNTLRLRYVNDHYDAQKKKALFGDPNFRVAVNAQDESDTPRYWTVTRLFTASSTWILLLALAGFAFAFVLMNRPEFVLWLQTRSFLIGLATAIPFVLIAVIGSSAGKFLGKTTPWEPVKLSFLISYAGMLAASYRQLSKTYWGLPPARYLLPFLFVALLPLIPFFALSDFGQMLVFLGAYLTLYVVAVRRLPQVGMALTLVVVLVSASILAAGVYNTVVDVFTDQASVGAVERVKNLVSRGVPRRIHQRFYLWLNAGTPPDPETHWWWQRDAEQAADRGASNEDAWYTSYAFQPSQALFGVSDGRLLGAGLGRGYPEIVPIADSDYIYAALAEELGLVGGALLLLTYIILLVAGLRVAIEARDMFTKLLAAGITAFFGCQALVNVGGVIRMLPMTGITLPFVSHGGWSLITSFVMLGVLMALSHQNNMAEQTVQRAVV